MSPMSKGIDMGLSGKPGHSYSRSKAVASLAREYKTIFQQLMLYWYERNRRGYAWRAERDPYKILVAEIMLQQTNADKVEPVYIEFVEKYPTINALAQSDLLALKAVLMPLGLDYRVGRLKNIAEKLVTEHGGAVPRVEKSLLALPGIGRYVANAVLCFAYSLRVALVDVNIVRLYGRVFGFRSQKNRPRDDNKVWEFAAEMLPETKFKEYNLALLDFTAAVCTSRRPGCVKCPITDICLYYTRSGEINGN